MSTDSPYWRVENGQIFYIIWDVIRSVYIERKTHYVIEVLVKSVEFADGKRDTEPKDDFIPVDDNNLPFG